MIVVSDTSSLNYLVLIGEDRILPALFGRVVAPSAVITELGRAKAPDVVRRWANNLPAWLEVCEPTTVARDRGLGPGESEAIALAIELDADMLLIDERDGTAEARRLGLNVTGTLGVMELAAQRGLLSLPSALAALCRTTFRGPQKLIDDLLKRDEERRSGSGS